MDNNNVKLFKKLDNNGKLIFVDVLPSIVTNTFIFYETISEQKKTLNVKYVFYTLNIFTPFQPNPCTQSLSSNINIDEIGSN